MVLLSQDDEGRAGALQDVRLGHDSGGQVLLPLSVFRPQVEAGRCSLPTIHRGKASIPLLLNDLD